MSYVGEWEREYAADIAHQYLTRLAVIDVRHCEGFAKVAEDSCCQTVSVCADEAHVVFVADRIESLLLAVLKIRCNNHLALRY